MSLYKIAAYAGTPVWTDITPGPGHEPMHQFGLSPDPTNNQHLVMIGYDGSTTKRFSSTDQGTSWSDHGTTSSNRGVKAVNKTQIIFGLSSISHSTDDGSSFNSKVGDWGDSIGSLSTIEGIWALI